MKTPETIKGYCIRAPRLTARAYGLITVYLILPFLTVLGLLDVVLYALFKLQGSCYGIGCWL